MPRIVCISDTHNRLESIKPLPEGDILIHAGDMCIHAHRDADVFTREVKDLARWMGDQPHRLKVLIAGNHDWPLYNQNQDLLKKFFGDYGIFYLQDNWIKWAGLKIYGSPWTPTFYNWAFMAPRGGAISEKWKLIPDDTDILVTHGPPYGILDPAISADHAGCESLLTELTYRVKPKLHIFGHLHEGHGINTEALPPTIFVNASLLNDDYDPIFDPIVVDL